MSFSEPQTYDTLIHSFTYNDVKVDDRAIRMLPDQFRALRMQEYCPNQVKPDIFGPGQVFPPFENPQAFVKLFVAGQNFGNPQAFVAALPVQVEPNIFGPGQLFPPRDVKRRVHFADPIPTFENPQDFVKLFVADQKFKMDRPLKVVLLKPRDFNPNTIKEVRCRSIEMPRRCSKVTFKRALPVTVFSLRSVASPALPVTTLSRLSIPSLVKIEDKAPPRIGVTAVPMYCYEKKVDPTREVTCVAFRQGKFYLDTRDTDAEDFVYRLERIIVTTYSVFPSIHNFGGIITVEFLEPTVIEFADVADIAFVENIVLPLLCEPPLEAQSILGCHVIMNYMILVMMFVALFAIDSFFYEVTASVPASVPAFEPAVEPQDSFAWRMISMYFDHVYRY